MGPWCPASQVTRHRHQRNSTAFNKPEDHLLYKARLPVLLELTPQPPTLRLSLGPPCTCPTQLRKGPEQLRQDAQDGSHHKPGIRKRRCSLWVVRRAVHKSQTARCTHHWTVLAEARCQISHHSCPYPTLQKLRSVKLVIQSAGKATQDQNQV